MPRLVLYWPCTVWTGHVRVRSCTAGVHRPPRAVYHASTAIATARSAAFGMTSDLVYDSVLGLTLPETKLLILARMTTLSIWPIIDGQGEPIVSLYIILMRRVVDESNDFTRSTGPIYRTRPRRGHRPRRGLVPLTRPVGLVGRELVYVPAPPRLRPVL